MIAPWIPQVWSVVRLELKKSFFSRRGLWVYLLAAAPVAMMLLHSLVEVTQGEQRRSLAGARPVSAAILSGVVDTMTLDNVLERAGEPHLRRDFPLPRGGQRVILQYTDGRDLYTFSFIDGRSASISRRTRDTVQTDVQIFATVFQFFFLRLAIFFGCVGIFTNLFRGELLDKSLHYYLLTPLRREVLAAGKFLAGLTATVVIFGTSTLLQLWALSLHFDSSEIRAYLDGPGWGHVASYMGVTAAACLGYGSVFLVAGLLFRNPIIPAALVQVWEGLNIFLPAALKRVSVIYYLQSLCPVVASPDEKMNELLKLLVNAAEPVSAPVAIAGLVAVSGAGLWLAGRLARNLEINYSAE